MATFGVSVSYPGFTFIREILQAVKSEVISVGGYVFTFVCLLVYLSAGLHRKY